MIHPPTIIAVDDTDRELHAITQALRSLDMACLPVKVSGLEVDIAQPLTGVRLVFFDINYLPGVSSKVQMFEVAATILQKVISKDNGPYVLITWTSKSDQHEELMEVLSEVEEIPTPAVSASLAKEKFVIVGDRIGEGKGGGANLWDEIRAVFTSHPQIRALMQWELSARRAAGEVVCSLLDMFERKERFIGFDEGKLKTLLTHMAVCAVGEKNVAGDRRAAINEALAPILFDRLVHQSSSDDEEEMWKQAMEPDGVPLRIGLDQAQRLNTFSHIALPGSGSMQGGDRGVVFTLSNPIETLMAERANITVQELASEFVEFMPPKTSKSLLPDLAELEKSCRWVLIGTRAVCDQAQARGTLRPVVLGLEVPHEVVSQKSGLRLRKHGAASITPSFAVLNNDGTLSGRCVIVNWHWMTSFSMAEITGGVVLYRLREALVNQVSASMSGYTARPGIVQFG